MVSVATTMLAFTLLNSSIPALIDLYEERYRAIDKQKVFPNSPSNLNLPVKETFDFIIIGGGTAGCVLARRLSKRYKVLVLEAGGTPPPITMVPYVEGLFSFATPIHFFYKSIKQKDANLARGGIVRSSGGKMLGGSSSHNAVHYERGSPYGYDEWARITKDESWEYKNVLKFFLKSEDYRGEFTAKNGQHRTGGLLPVVKVTPTFREDIWFSAGKEMGYDKVDSHGSQRVGFSPIQYNEKNGRRFSSYVAFLKGVEKKRKKLTVRRYAVVSKIIFEGTHAIGVEYEWHGVHSVVFSTKEIILSAGAYISPIILMRSGIGPKDQLKLANVKPVAILPVGQYLQDHVRIDMPRIHLQDRSVIRYGRSNLTFEDFEIFLKTKKGTLEARGKHEAFIASSRAINLDKNSNWADIQLYLQSLDGTLSCAPNLVRPYSSGRLFYNQSATSLESSLIPVIDYNFFSDETDFDVIIEGIKLCYKIVETKTFTKVGAKMGQISMPVCESEGAFGSKTFWKCYLRQLARTDNHLIGTNRMGNVDDPMAVVDSKLRVLGVSGLRVCDASIMPSIPNANIAGPIMMIAEKTADTIIKYWRKKIS